MQVSKLLMLLSNLPLLSQNFRSSSNIRFLIGSTSIRAKRYIEISFEESKPVVTLKIMFQKPYMSISLTPFLENPDF